MDAFSQSFVETSADVDAVRKAAAELGQHPFIIAKIERAGALVHIDEILKAAEGIMIARGDLGVETPIERMAVVQKQLIHKANLLFSGSYGRRSHECRNRVQRARSRHDGMRQTPSMRHTIEVGLYPIAKGAPSAQTVCVRSRKECSHEDVCVWAE